MASLMDRETLVGMLHAATVAGRLDFGRSLAAEWLAVWPGDAEVALHLAAVELRAGMAEAAIGRLSKIIEIDPEGEQAYTLLADAYEQTGDRLRAPLYRSCAQALGGELPNPESSPAWAAAIARAIGALNEGDSAEAVRAADEALSADPSVALPALVAVKARLASGSMDEAFRLSEIGHDRWPECVAFSLVQGRARLTTGRQAAGVELLHRFAAADPLGIIAESVLGIDHPYRALWPERMEAPIRRTMSEEVALALGEKRSVSKENLSNAGLETLLPQPEPWEAYGGPNSGDEPSAGSESLAIVRNEFERLAEQLNARRPSEGDDARLPAYVVLSSHTRLVQQLGQPGFDRIDGGVMSLVEAVRRKRGWAAYRFYVDDPRSVEPFGLLPCDPGNAWQIKLRLADLDRTLAERGEMIGAVLIVGGDRIVPFHLLPNPTDDDDDSVPSDNPYATTDENYFAPEWPVGRLPVDYHPDLLAALLRSATTAHRVGHRASMNMPAFGVWLRDQFGRLFRPRPKAIGFSASIWRKASLAVFRAIGAPSSMITSPPAEAGNMPTLVGRPSPLSYFNLHGLEDSPEWYGQRDPLRDASAAVEFPVALRPEDVVNGGQAPKIVFSEACYGAHVIDKTSDTALSLKFLSSGSQAVIGSTKISYGSVTPPLIAADLLGRLFWDQLRLSLPVGEALRRAKLELASEMHSRQGFLDGEDQKTLISFVLYGDPLYSAGRIRGPRTAKTIARPLERPKLVKTACALGGPNLLSAERSALNQQRISSIVASYLPTMVDAESSLRNQHQGCDHEDHCCPTQQMGMKTAGENDAMVVTLSRHVTDGSKLHPNFARMTLDKGGKVIKLAVSR